MNRTAIIIVSLVALIAVLGFIFYYSGANGVSKMATSTPNVTVTDTNGAVTRTSSKPTVVTNPSATSYDTAVIVNGSITPNGALTTYWYEYGATQSLGNKTADQNVGSGYTLINAPLYISGLNKSTTYYYRVAASNKFGTAYGETHTFKTTNNTPAPIGTSPSIKTLPANNIGRTSATVNGEVQPNKASTTYWFEYGKTADLGSITSFESVGNGDTNLTAAAVINNLAPQTKYYYRVNAQNQFGTVNGTIMTFTTSGPAVQQASAPTAVTRNVTDVGTSTATLNGSVTPNGDETTYWFEYSTSSLLGGITPQTTNHISAGSGTGAQSVSANLSTLKGKTAYNYRVVAQNSKGTTYGDRSTFKTK